MKKQFFLLPLLCLLLCSSAIIAQQITQTIRGRIIDQESKIPLIGANVLFPDSEEISGTSTDVDGYFRLENIPIGRHNIEITYIGYEPRKMANILITSGKELVLNIELVESAVLMEEVVVSGKNIIDKTKPLNSFATLSARTFSVEETARYAAASFDPARMAQNYAGVSVGASSDLFNEIVIRGNSPAGVLWRLEGIEIPNPNHFGNMGNSGGAISMLSSSTLSNSDFYTGAFPSEFGNATSGVFDLKMRNGNNEKREYSFMFGALGVEASTEGPFKKGGKSSYLINYRYSTLALLQATGINPTGDILPTYQDLSFKFNFPTKKAGVFGIFGLGGNNLAASVPAKDSLEWESPDDREGFDQIMDVGTVGLTHRILLGSGSYLRTVAIGSYERATTDIYLLNNNYDEETEGKDKMLQKTFRVSSTYHNKLNAKNSIQLGGIVAQKKFDFIFDRVAEGGTALLNLFDNSAQSALVQGFGQIKHRFNGELTLNAGIHYSLLTLNNAMSLEPRGAISWQMSPKHKLALSVGLHSKMEHLALYATEGEFDDGDIVSSKKNLGFSKSLHNVIGYDYIVNPNLRIKTEVYYQYLYNIPVAKDPTDRYSILNAFDVWDYFGLPEAVADGRARNIGLDITIEKFFSSQYYFLMTGSLYDSKFSPKDGNWYNTRFNGNYQLNVLGGKEFAIGKNKKNILGFNGKAVLSGGNRSTPINLPASIEAKDDIYFEDQLFEQRSPAYYRFDLGMSYKINTKNMTHTIMFDVQNITNRENIFEYEFNESTLMLEEDTQTGFFPFVNYRIEF